jgi:hypothetical protein
MATMAALGDAADTDTEAVAGARARLAAVTADDETVGALCAAGLALGVATALITAGTVYVASQAVADHTHPATVPTTVRAPRSETIVMGMMRELPFSREASEPSPPWERPDFVAAGFESVEHFTRAPDDDDPSSP